MTIENKKPNEHHNSGKDKEGNANQQCKPKYWSFETNNIIAAGTIILGIVATCSLMETCHQIHIENRAWIAPMQTNFKEPPRAQEALHFVVGYKNSGRTAAQNMGYNLVPYQIGPIPEDISKLSLPPNTTCRDITEETIVVFPDIPYDAEIYTTQKLADDGPEAIANGKIGIVVMGCFRYEDIFHYLHRSWFCNFYNPKVKLWRACPTGNGID